jgi:hypothetical protein
MFSKVEKHLYCVVGEWLSSIHDIKLSTDLIQNELFYISGGCIPSLLLGDGVNDYDIFLADERTRDRVVTYYEEKYKKDFDDHFFKKTPLVTHLTTENAITHEINGQKIQIITRFFGDPSTVHKTFDFEHCKPVYWYGKNKKLKITKAIAEAILNKQVLYSPSQFPLNSLMRLSKLLFKGWWIQPDTFLTLLKEAVHTDFSDLSKVQEDLKGFSAAYNIEWVVVDYLKTAYLELSEGHHDLKTKEECLRNSPYIYENIQEIFGLDNNWKPKNT